jgi:ribonuclease HI
MKYTVYTDGSCITQTRQGGWSWVCEQTGEFNSGSEGDTTVNEMEMTAVAQAVRAMPDNSEVEIVTDSKLVCGWLGKNWACDANPRIGEIRESIRRMRTEKSLILSLRKVAGHDGNPLNERCDKLAKAASRLAPEERPEKGAFQWLEVVMTVQDADISAVRARIEKLQSLGGHVTGGEAKAYDGKWNLIAHGQIKDNKMDVGRQL